MPVTRVPRKRLAATPTIAKLNVFSSKCYSSNVITAQPKSSIRRSGRLKNVIERKIIATGTVSCCICCRRMLPQALVNCLSCNRFAHKFCIAQHAGREARDDGPWTCNPCMEASRQEKRAIKTMLAGVLSGSGGLEGVKTKSTPLQPGTIVCNSTDSLGTCLVQKKPVRSNENVYVSKQPRDEKGRFLPMPLRESHGGSISKLFSDCFRRNSSRKSKARVRVNILKTEVNPPVLISGLNQDGGHLQRKYLSSSNRPNGSLEGLVRAARTLNGISDRNGMYMKAQDSPAQILDKETEIRQYFKRSDAVWTAFNPLKSAGLKGSGKSRRYLSQAVLKLATDNPENIKSSIMKHETPKSSRLKRKGNTEEYKHLEDALAYGSCSTAGVIGSNLLRGSIKQLENISTIAPTYAGLRKKVAVDGTRASKQSFISRVVRNATSYDTKDPLHPLTYFPPSSWRRNQCWNFLMTFGGDSREKPSKQQLFVPSIPNEVQFVQ